MAWPLALLAACNAGDTTSPLSNSNSQGGAPNRIVVSSEVLNLTMIGDTARFSAKVVDGRGKELTTIPSVTIETGSDVVTLLAQQQAVVARKQGTVTLLITADSATARITVHVNPAAPRPMRIIGDTIRPGAPFTILGEAFGNLTELTRVVVNGIEATVLATSRTHIEAVVPRSSVPCQATQDALVRVSVASAQGEMLAPLSVATRVQLNRGASASLLDSLQARCTELVNPSSGEYARYIVAVINTDKSPSTTSSFVLQGAGTGAMTGRDAVNLAAQNAEASANVRLPPALQALEQAERGHGTHLARQQDLVRQRGLPGAAWRTHNTSRGNVAAAMTPASVGDIVTVKAMYNSCLTGQNVQARVVYAGTRAVVLEDVSAPRAGTMDDEYRAIGQEFDAVQYPLLKEYIGDPLAMNTTLKGDGRVTMLFTRYVNDSAPGIAGYVTACNFYPKSVLPASNEQELFYARVPDMNETPAAWRRGMRSTVIHEAKHLASYAERFASNNPFEESWLEESTARIAEELYSRQFSGGGNWKGNTGYATTVRCEIYQCDDRPLMMWKHFSTLHAWQRAVDELTPLGASANGDFTFYASGWSFVRWAADHYATNEGQWLRALVRGGQRTGIGGLEQATGRSAAELLGDWAMATAVDDVAGAAPDRAELTMPSWNTSDIMRGLAETYPGMFKASPLNMRNYTFGQFSLTVERLRSFSASYFSFSGDAEGSQVIELRDAQGGAAPGGLRLAVYRVE